MYVFFTDADMSTPIEELEKFISNIKQGYDIVIGSRSIEGANILKHQPIYRELMGKIFNRLVNEEAALRRFLPDRLYDQGVRQAC